MIYHFEIRLRVSFAPRRLLKKGSDSLMNITATIRAINESMNDSERNWATSMPLVDPATFFIPTSFALLDAWAVDRFIKLIAAIKTISIAILPNILRYLGSTEALKSCCMEVSR